MTYTYPSPASSTPFQYVGDLPALGSLNLLQLIRSYEELNPTSLAEFFPDEVIPERTVIIEQIFEGLGIAPIVQPGRPAGSFVEPERIQQRTVTPAYVREDDFLDQFLINQLRRPGSMNEAYRPEDLVARRVQRLMTRMQRTKAWLQVQAMTGAIQYTDPRTKVSINVSTQIPERNFWNYRVYTAAVAAGNTLTGTSYTAATATVQGNRPEALVFVNSSDTQAAVPWTNPDADIVRTVRMLKAWNRKTNKNEYTHLIWSADLEAHLMANNRFLKSYSGQIGVFTITASTGSAGVSAVPGSTGPLTIRFNGAGEVQEIAGLQVMRVESLFRDPSDNRIKDMWPANRVALVSLNHVNDRSERLGATMHCVGEAPDGQPGMWVVSMPHHVPPSPPSWVIQVGDAYLPFARHPEWITILTVCEPNDLSISSILQADIGANTF